MALVAEGTLRNLPRAVHDHPSYGARELRRAVEFTYLIKIAAQMSL